MIHLGDPTTPYVPKSQQCGPFGERPTIVANTCAPSVREGYHTGRNHFGCQNTTRQPVHSLWIENITEYTHVTDLK